MDDEWPEPWARQPGEPNRLFHLYTHYRDLGPTRSIDRAFVAHRTACQGRPEGGKRASRHWQRTAVRWGWRERAEAWDAEVDRQTRAATAKEHSDIRLRHARVAQGAMTALSVPVRTVIDALQQDPALLTRLVDQVKGNPMALLSVVAVAARVASIFPGLAVMERAALGVTVTPTSTIESPEARRTWSFATRITSDPVATDLAIQLLDALAHDDTPRPR
jgi:hypothetical protein